MEDFTLPFPDRALADQELSYDPCYRKIQNRDKRRIVDQAWKKGREAARKVFREQNGSYDFFRIARDSGLKIVEKNIDNVQGGTRYFSDYLSGRNEIILYLKSVALWAKQNHLETHQAENLILSHEYFHFLEMNGLGRTSKDYLVPMIQLGKLKIGRTGIRALSEIGAHAFARTYYEEVRNHDGNQEAGL